MGLLRPLHHVDTIIAWVVAFDRNQWSRSTGMPGRVRLESVVAIDRKTHWCNYYRYAVAKRMFANLDHHVWRVTYKWAKRRHPRKNRRWVVNRY